MKLWMFGLTLVVGSGVLACGGNAGDGVGDGSGAAAASSGGESNRAGRSSGGASSGGAPSSGPSSGGAPAASGGGTMVQVDSGLAEDKRVEDLSAEELRGLCESVAEGADQILNDVVCDLAAFSAVTALVGQQELQVARDQCQLVYDSCAADPEAVLMQAGATTPSTSANCDAELTGVTDCPVTVGEYEACVGDQLLLVQDSLAVPSCAELTEADLAGGLAAFALGNTETPASCAAVESCRGL